MQIPTLERKLDSEKMKAMKGKLLKKLKTIKAIGYLKPDRILQVNASDGFVPNSPPKSDFGTQFDLKLEEPKKILQSPCVKKDQEPEIIDVAELMKDLEDQEMDEIDDKENMKPNSNMKKDSTFMKEKQEILCSVKKNTEVLGEISNFRRPDMDSGTLFDPNLLEAFEQAVMEIKAQEAEERRARIEIKDCQGIEEEPPIKARKIEEKAEKPIINPLLEFEEKCPPGGNDSVILYTTGLRGIRKTFEDCRKIRSLLDSFKILYFERDISMHSEYKDELWEILGGKIVPPKLFIKGRYIGGAEEVLGLLEQGKFKLLLDGIPIDESQGHCESCNGVRFIMCFKCNGSRKIAPADANGEAINCPECNENGLLICPLCC